MIDACAASWRATISRPLVSRSRRCTIPGRWTPAMPPHVEPSPCASSALTKVPPLCPGDGWTTRPAGLSRISRSSSSYTIRSGISGAGARSSATALGTSRRSSVPAPTIAFAFRASPPAVSRPSEMSFWTKLRDRPVASATYRSTRPADPSGTWSTRTPAADGSTIRPFLTPADERGEDRRADEQEERGADGSVGHVERVEANAADADIDEVDDVAEAQPIQQVAERPAQQEAERDRQVEASAGAGVVADDQSDDDKRSDPEDERVLGEQPEQGARVPAEDQPDIVTEDIDDLPGRDVRDEPRLGQLVHDHDRHGDPAEHQPVRPRAERRRRAGGSVRLTGRRPAHAARARRRSAIVTRQPSRSSSAVDASLGGSPTPMFAKVSLAIVARWRATASGRGRIHRSIWSSSSRFASRR